MKIEKGKLYLDIKDNTLFKADFDSDNHGGFASDKIAVYCPTKEDWDYVIEKYNIEGIDSYWEVYEKISYIAINCEMFGDIESNTQNNHIITFDDFKRFYPDSVNSNKTNDNVQNTQPHYDNTHGSLYKIAEQRKWNSYQFDIVKRIDRALKKGQFKEDLQKTKDLIDLWLREESN